MKGVGATGRSAPRLRRAVDPDGTEPTAFGIGNDLPPCRGAINAGVLAELAGIPPAHDQKRHQKPQNGPASANRCQPHPEPAEVAPSFSACLSCGFGVVSGGGGGFRMAFLDGPACGIGGGEDGFQRQFFYSYVHALANCLVDVLPPL